MIYSDFIQTKSFFFQRIEAIIARLVQVYDNNIAFTLRILLCLYKITINYLLSPFFYVFLISTRSFILPFFVSYIY